MRFSLIGRELVNDAMAMHLSANNVAGLIAVVACDKPPVGTVAAVLEHNLPAVILSDGSIKPGIDPDTGVRIDLVTAFQAAGDQDAEVRARVALGETLAEQVQRLGPPNPDGNVIHAVATPFRSTGGLRLLRGNLAPDGGAILKIAGIEGEVTAGVFTGRARVFNSERHLIAALDRRPEDFRDNDMVVIRYEGPRGAPGMPEMLDPTSRITALCRRRRITVAFMTDARFSGGSVGLVIGQVGPEAFLGGPIALLEDGDTIVVDVHADRIDCQQLDDSDTLARRATAWRAAVDANGGIHPHATPVTHRVLQRMRATALPALRGGGMAATYHPGRRPRPRI